jgi:hypothetical protein
VFSFPTTLFTRRNGKVRRVHAGFAAPAALFHAQAKKDFEDLIEKLLAE